MAFLFCCWGKKVTTTNPIGIGQFLYMEGYNSYHTSCRCSFRVGKDRTLLRRNKVFGVYDAQTERRLIFTAQIEHTRRDGPQTLVATASLSTG